MRRAFQWILVGVVGIILPGLWPVTVGWGQQAGDPENGRAPYEQYCAVCHGARGLGNGPMAKATSPPASKLTSSDVRRLANDELLRIIADGKGSTMPAWRGILSDQQLLDVVAYVRTLGR